MIRVVVIEDSATARQVLVEALESDPGIRVVGQARDGREGVELVARLRPDLVTMDIHMPVMDGIAATREIMARTPTPIVVVTASGRAELVELSLEATRAGALMVLAKPEHPAAPAFERERAQLVSMVRAMAAVKVVRRFPRRVRPAPPPRPARAGAEPASRIIAVAASTGGPAALREVLGGLPADFGAPLLIVQHIATGFVAGLARWLQQATALRVKVAEDGEPLRIGSVYLAPDERHLGVRGAGVALADAPPIGGFRPSADHLFDSVARRYGAAATAVILTGMGSDGVDGLRAVRGGGGRVIAQDEATSVVYGMPQAAVRAGVVDAILPVHELAPRLVQLVSGETHG